MLSGPSKRFDAPEDKEQIQQEITADQRQIRRRHDMYAKHLRRSQKHRSCKNNPQKITERNFFVLFQRGDKRHQVIGICNQNAQTIIKSQKRNGNFTFLIHSRTQKQHQNTGYNAANRQNAEDGGADVFFRFLKDAV